MQLRPYQIKTRHAVTKKYVAGKKRVVAVMPTGAGKTVLGSDFVRGAVEKQKRVVWIAHRSELLTQAKNTIEHLVGCQVGIVAPFCEPNPDAPVQVASLQTLLSRGHAPEADLLVIDECHHLSEGAPEWAKVTSAYKDIYWLGLTATPERGDGHGLAPMWHDLVAQVGYRELIQTGALVPCEVYTPKGGADSASLAMSPAEAYAQYGDGEQAVVFSASVKEAMDLVGDFGRFGVRAACVHGDLPDELRKDILSRYAKGEIQVLTNVYVLTEGWDCPAASVCILARGCGSCGTFLQMVGRVMRPFEGKTICRLIDLCGASDDHGHPQGERTYSLTGTGIELTAKKEARESAKREKEAREQQEQQTKEVLKRGLVKLEPLAMEARGEWERLEKLAGARGFKINWAQQQFREKFGSKPPSDWVSQKSKENELQSLRRLAKERGYKPKWADMRYKVMFGSWPKKAR